MKRIRLNAVGTHLLASLIGVALAWKIVSTPPTDGGKLDLGSKAVAGAEAAGRPERVTRPVLTRASSSDYLEAWKQLLAEPIPSGKASLKSRLLLEWLEIDLSAALGAALRDDRELLRVFRKRMEEQPELFWPAIQDGRFGSRTPLLLDAWIEIVSDTKQEVLVDHLPDLGPLARGRAVRSCVISLKDRPVELLSLLRRLGGMPDTPANREVWKLAGEELAGIEGRKGDSLQEISSRITAAESPGERRLLVHELAVRLGDAERSREEIERHLGMLPQELRADAAVSILSHCSGNQSLLAAADHLIREGEWQALTEGSAKASFRGALDQPGFKDLVDWAEKLPERPETVELYRSIVFAQTKFFALKEYKVWLEAVPEGWKRNQALIVYVSGASSRPDPTPEQLEGIQWAIGAIGDESLKAEAHKASARWR